LKVACPVMLVRNLDQDAGLVNGARGKVEGFAPEAISVKFDNGQVAKISLFLFTKFNAQSRSVAASRQQFPLVLAYALTIHKAQGLELPAVEV
ncbi:hypothetical protein CAPTEDRAFT_57783, partial [Capitella teleta]